MRAGGVDAGGMVAGLFLVGLLACAPAPVRADTPAPGKRATWMTVEEMRAALVGRPAAGVYPDGIAWTETMHESGRTDYTEKGEHKAGDWYFSPSAELCFRYDHGQGGGCFRYVRLGPNCYEHFIEIGSGPPGDGPGARFLTNGKLWRTDEPATCDERPSV